jgi:ribosomal protein S12 methylthiotransferase accessory factor
MFKNKTDFEFSPWDFEGSTDQEFTQLQQIISDNGFHIYCAEYLQCGMYSCRLLVPGMSEIYPIDDLVWNNKGTGAQLRPYLLRLPDMTKEELSELFELIETLGLNEQQLVSQIIGVLFDDHSNWAALSIGELKALILLALNRRDEAAMWCSWCLDYGALPQNRKRLYRLLQSLLNFQIAGDDINDFFGGLNLFYQAEELHEAESILNGTLTFPGLNFSSSWIEISSQHKNLLEIYEQVNRWKAISTP